ncbi:29342_t:CDS:1, partial [Racocetra persica]
YLDILPFERPAFAVSDFKPNNNSTQSISRSCAGGSQKRHGTTQY